MKSRGSCNTYYTMSRIIALLLLITQVDRSETQATLPGSAVGGNIGPDPWQQERPPNMPNIQNLEVMCAKDHMEVQLSFDKPFTGLVFSKGQFGHDNCVYVQPRSGRNNFRFSIIYNGCGTKPDAKGKFYENTVVVQYDEELIEVWDEAKRLRCEWYNDYEKTATKPPMVIADLEVVELNFRGDNVDCWMEIQNGKGPWASPISGIVPLGSTLTMVVAINDLAGEFDMRVKSCEASDGVNRPIQLSDEHGCVLRPKMVSKFLKLRSNDGRSTVMSYAFFHAFKFPDSLQVYIRCKVEICRHGCPEHCDKSLQQQRIPDQIAYTSETKASYSTPQQAVPVAAPVPLPPQPVAPPPPPPAQRRTPLPPLPPQPVSSKRPFFGIIGGRNKPAQPQQSVPYLQKKKDTPFAAAQIGLPPPPQVQAQVVEVPIPIPGSQTQQDPVVVSVPAPIVQSADGGSEASPRLDDGFVKQQLDEEGVEINSNAKLAEGTYSERGGRFPHGPRSLFKDEEMIHIDDITSYETKKPVSVNSDSKKSRTKRSYTIHQRQVRSADVGVKTGYEVISAVDLAFSLNGNNSDQDENSPGVTIFQGKMREEVVYGICLPAPGFSALFVLLAMCVVISVLVASFLCYHRQLQKADREGCPSGGAPSSLQSQHQMAAGFMGLTPAVPFRDWSTVHFIRNPSNNKSSHAESQ